MTRRSAAEWTVRVALAAVVVVLGLYGVSFSAAQAVLRSNPALAYRLAPYDGRITAAYATSLAGIDASPSDRARSDILAKRALLQDPTAVAAAATLGVNAEIRGDKASARRYFGEAQKLSRRDLRTQLFMIEDAVQRNDIPGTLRQYDVTLRVFPALGDMLYPVLTAASGDPIIRGELVKTLSRRPAWGASFIVFAATHTTDAKAIGNLLSSLRLADVPISETSDAGIIDALLASRDWNAAWSYYQRIRAGVDRRRSRDPHFVSTFETPTQLDWRSTSDDSALATSIQNGVFDFTAPPSVGGPMLQQVQLLPAGRYRLNGHSLGIEQSPGALPYWTLRCRDGRELGRVEVPNSSVAKGNFSGIFSVPPDCPLQTLDLLARPSNAVTGLSGQIDHLEVVPAP